MTKHLTLAQRHQLRVRAEKESAELTPADSMAGATTYEMQLMQLKQHQMRLKQMQSLDARNKLKQQLLPEYDAYIDGVLAGGNGAADEVLTTVMIWHLDTTSFARGLEIAAYALEHGLNPPDRFERTLATIVAEEVANGALVELKAGNEFDIDVLQKTHELTAEHDMPDEVRAKLQFALGLSLKPHEDATPETLEQAKGLLTEAIRLHDRVGAKTQLNQVERWLKKHAEQAQEEQPDS